MPDSPADIQAGNTQGTDVPGTDVHGADVRGRTLRGACWPTPPGWPVGR